MIAAPMPWVHALGLAAVAGVCVAAVVWRVVAWMGARPERRPRVRLQLVREDVRSRERAP